MVYDLSVSLTLLLVFLERVLLVLLLVLENYQPLVHGEY